MGLEFRGAQFGTAYSSETFNAVTDTGVETLTVPPGDAGGWVVGALLSVTGAEPIKWRVDGVSPTATIGHPLASGSHIEVWRNDMSALRFVCGTAGQTTDVFVTYFRE